MPVHPCPSWRFGLLFGAAAQNTELSRPYAIANTTIDIATSPRPSIMNLTNSTNSHELAFRIILHGL